LILLFVQDEGGSFSLPTLPNDDDDDVIRSVASTSATPLTSAISSKVKSESVSKTSSRSGTPRSRSNMKRTLQEAFAEGAARESEMHERLGIQKHERAIGELELKRRKLENKAMEKQHQREREREQHEFHMLQMRLMMSQNRQAVPAMMQTQNQPSLGGFGLMAELDGATLPSDPSPLTPYSI
jgi:hypothetical protein